MNGETKRKIQSLRDILVGKLPAPTDQVKQITLGLIYKFMSDIDKENVDLLGGKSFFAGEFEKYSWDNIIDPLISSYERVVRYSEGLDTMNLNSNIPEFRNIFKGAYLPYKDPAILTQFLKEIDIGFKYEHSEDIGDAFEFLLSVMSTQGAAGQFRTPRHIIDFIVKVVCPNKYDRILDPACGTAGFLISAYKYILENNKAEGSDKPGSALTLTEKNKLTENFIGYDISPDMVSLSLVNMYLHNFANPNIKEYDTLTNDEFWDEDFDCIMANPPFMTPKGGIRPHKRFAIQANRSELLFVDYIAEHLLPNGKAGVIVPEGIIFQSSNAYKALRKMLIENGLYAVVSLPSGVFQPYSGVKTSILLIDKKITNMESVLFIDIKNTGISLGATNMPIEENDLPEAMTVLENLKNGKEIESHICWKATKEIIKENDYNLSCSRYKPVTLNSDGIKTYMLKDFSEIKKGKSSSTKTIPGRYPLYLTADTQKTADHFDFDGDGVAIPLISALGHGKAAIKRIHRVKGKFAIADLLAFISLDTNIANPDFIYYLLDYAKNDIAKLMKGAANVSMKIDDLESFSVPLPPVDIQKELAEEINEYKKIIDGARQVVENYKLRIEIDPEWKKIKIGDLCDLYNGKAFKPSDWEKKESGGLPIVRIQNLNNNNLEYNYFTGKIDNQVIINNGDLLFSWSGSRGTSFGPHIWNGGKAILNQHIFKVIHKDNILRKFFYFMLKDAVKEVEENLHGGVGLVHITKRNLEIIETSLPPLKIQKQVVEKIETEITTVESCRKLIEIFEQKIKEKINNIWN
ncbi:MAG: N-6 DNA methylase [Actinobacteria bacterium]|nr:N-6 DNA methylase [Actinomycetota bacterium]MCL6088376.1 N-6 DNA methylase [Actinomycetota bacterium]